MDPDRMNTLTDLQAKLLCDKLREQIIDSVSKTGGHLASSLGVVEATVAVHRVFDLETDRLVFDVGQAGGPVRLSQAPGAPGGRLYCGPCFQCGVGGAGHGPGKNAERGGLQRSRHARRRGHDGGAGL